MADSKTNNPKVNKLGLEPFFIPGSILLAALMICSSVYFSLKNLNINSGPAVNKGPLFAIAEDIGINGDDLLACIDKADKAEINADIADGTAAGINSTPSFIIGEIKDGKVEGVVFAGAQSYDSFKSVIEGYLGRGNFDKTQYKTATVSFDDDPRMGNSNAKVAILEFSDYECPFCKQFHIQTFDRIKTDFIDSGDVYYVYRDLPLSIHEPKASEYAQAANCVKQISSDEKYFEFSAQLFEKTQANGQGIPD